MSFSDYCRHRHQIKYAVLITCKESHGFRLQRLIEREVTLAPILILSIKDQPHLRNVENLAEVIPSTVKSIFVDDVDLLFPLDDLNEKRSLEFLRALHQRVSKPGLLMLASRTTDSGPLRVEAFDARPE